jgi:hypothetical protein
MASAPGVDDRFEPVTYAGSVGSIPMLLVCAAALLVLVVVIAR